MKIDGIECNEHGVPEGGFLVGDVVDWMGLIGKITSDTPENKIYPMGFYSEDAIEFFSRMGMIREIHTRPSLRLVSRPRPKLDGWFNDSGNISYGPYASIEEAMQSCSKPYTRQVYMRECDPPEAKEDGQ